MVFVQNILGTRQADDVLPGDEDQTCQIGFDECDQQNYKSHQDPEIKKNGHLAVVITKNKSFKYKNLSIANYSISSVNSKPPHLKIT